MKVIISCHIDSTYKGNFAFDEGKQFRGSFDNLAGVAAVLSANLSCKVYFTQGEEKDFSGAKKVAKLYKNKNVIIIVVDVSKEWIKRKTIPTMCLENYSLNEKNKKTLTRWAKGKNVFCLPKSEEDEATFYGKQGIQSFSACLPIWGKTYHNRKGTYIKKGAIENYIKLLKNLVGTFKDKLEALF